MTDRRNTGKQEQEMRAAALLFMAERRGIDVRVIHELVLGRRRIDLALIYAADIVGIEIKGPLDSLSGGRLDEQMHEYNFYLPEVWLAVVPKWLDHKHVKWARNLIVLVDGKFQLHGTPIKKKPWEPWRDEMCCSRVLERLWDGEARAVARRLGLVQTQLLDMMPGEKVKRILARLLTGHEIMREVCTELRSRPLTGIGSDDAHGRAATRPPDAMPAKYRGRRLKV